MGVYRFHTGIHDAIDIATELSLFEEDGAVSYSGGWGDSDERFGFSEDYGWIHIRDTLGEKRWEWIGWADEWGLDKSDHPI